MKPHPPPLQQGSFYRLVTFIRLVCVHVFTLQKNWIRFHSIAFLYFSLSPFLFCFQCISCFLFELPLFVFFSFNLLLLFLILETEFVKLLSVFSVFLVYRSELLFLICFPFVLLLLTLFCKFSIHLCFSSLFRFCHLFVVVGPFAYVKP